MVWHRSIHRFSLTNVKPCNIHQNAHVIKEKQLQNGQTQECILCEQSPNIDMRMHAICPLFTNMQTQQKDHALKDRKCDER